MKVPISSLKQFLKFTQTPEELAVLLTLSGIEVEGIDPALLKFSGVVVGQVIETNPHPFADRLTVAKVSDGTQEFQVVCGAPNCRAGIKTAFAKIGAVLVDEEGKSFKIKKSKLRDVESFGMLCSSQELDLGKEHDGIMELSAEFIVGQDLGSYYSNVILDISLTPNLGHCMSIYGLARELSAHLETPLNKPTFLLKEEGESIENLIKVQLIDKAQALRYACRVVSDIQVGPSPQWLKKRIESYGHRSINNVVDVGNLVMLEMGQPLHMFDYDKIEGKTLKIVSETSHTQLETLDDTVRLIPPDALLICDAEKPLAFAGVMGGKSSAICDTTTAILIEAAYFTPQAIRKTSRQINCKSDSSKMFEKGIDPNAVLESLNYAAFLLREVSNGKVAKGVIDNQAHAFIEKKIACRPYRVNQLLGTNLSGSEVKDFLRRLGIKTLEESSNQLLVSVPTYRNDIALEVDLIEEVARIYGYNHIPKSLPVHITSTIPNDPLYTLEKKVRCRLMAEGLQELMTCDLISPSQAALILEKTMSTDSLISVMCPSSLEQSVLRTSLLPGLLQAVAYNIDHGSSNISAFEIGRIHFKEKNDYFEPSTAGLILSGKSSPHHFDPKPQEFDFFDLKGMVENLLAGMKIEGITFETSHLHNFHPGRQAKIKVGSLVLGVLGEVHPEHIAKLNISQKVYFAEVNINALMSLLPKQWNVTDLSLFPGSERDWTITLKEELPIETVLHALQAVPSRLLEEVILLDLYKSSQIGKDRKNATFRFFYRDLEKTIALETVEREHTRITAAVSEKLNHSIS